jgi:hypothetical protein
MKSLIVLLQRILDELGDWCHTSTDQDSKTILARTEHEGLSFLTITLPNFGADFQKSLDQGYVAPLSFAGFQRRGSLPLFLGGFLEQVFSRDTGWLLDMPNVDAIYAIRQLTLMWAKINLPCTEKRTANAITKYLECEQDIKTADKSLDKDLRESFLDSVVYCGQICFLTSTGWSMKKPLYPGTDLALPLIGFEVILSTISESGQRDWMYTFSLKDISSAPGRRVWLTAGKYPALRHVANSPLISWIPVPNGL